MKNAKQKEESRSKSCPSQGGEGKQLDQVDRSHQSFEEEGRQEKCRHCECETRTKFQTRKEEETEVQGLQGLPEFEKPHQNAPEESDSQVGHGGLAIVPLEAAARAAQDFVQEQVRQRRKRLLQRRSHRNASRSNGQGLRKSEEHSARSKRRSQVRNQTEFGVLI